MLPAVRSGSDPFADDHQDMVLNERPVRCPVRRGGASSAVAGFEGCAGRGAAGSGGGELGSGGGELGSGYGAGSGGAGP
jgi:hypothetical protein